MFIAADKLRVMRTNEWLWYLVKEIVDSSGSSGEVRLKA